MARLRVISISRMPCFLRLWLYLLDLWIINDYMVDLILYNCFLLLYTAGARMLSRWSPKAALWVKGRINLFASLDRSLLNGQGPVVWMHCASLGEFEQGRPLLEAVRKTYPAYRILVSFFSPSGYEIRKNYKGADIVCYLPMDSKTNARNFLDKVQPVLVLWVKYEYWYYYLEAIQERKIPLLLVSGIFRANQPFFKWYGGLYRKILTFFTHLFVQTQESASRLARAGTGKAFTVSGDTRFDRVTDIAAMFEPIVPVEAFCQGHRVIVAGSTWPEDEEEMDHYANSHPELRFIIAPHEISEEHLKDTEKLFRHSIRYSRLVAGVPSVTVANLPNVLIIDNIGMLSRLYHYADITYVGGGFGDNGLHNILEAAVYGKPVLFGPNYDGFYEAEELTEKQGGFSIENALELEKLLDKLLSDAELLKRTGKAAQDYVYANRGATEVIFRYIQENRLLTN